MKRYKKDRGFIYAVVLLIMMPVFLFSISAVVNISNMNTFSNKDVSGAVSTSCKDAAMQINSIALAEGFVRINDANAHNRFRGTLASNLGLDINNNLQPLSNSAYVNKPRYWLLVYNGYADYTGCSRAKLYYFDGSVVTSSDVSGVSGFPQFFTITGSGIVAGSGSGRVVKLDTPGVIALVRIEGSRITGDIPLDISRWACARVVCNTGTCRAY